MSTQQQDQHWHAGGTEIQQLKAGGPDHRPNLQGVSSSQAAVNPWHKEEEKNDRM